MRRTFYHLRFFVLTLLACWPPQAVLCQRIERLCEYTVRTGLFLGSRGAVRSGLGCVMDLFLSHFRHKLDSKGRVSVPAPFRAVLTHQDSAEIYAHPHVDAPAYEAGGKALLAEVNERLQNFPPYSLQREQMALAILGSGELMKLDGDGRITLSEAVCAKTGINKEVIFVGLGGRFQIWAPQAFTEQAKSAQAEVRALWHRESKVT